MKLSKYLKEIDKNIVLIHNYTSDIEISFITNDSRKVESNTLFVAIKGEVFDGHHYIEYAINSGAGVIVCHRLPEKIDERIVYVKVKDTYYTYALLTEVYFDYPGRELKIIGVTGTNGKTTCAFLINHILNQAGKKCGLISTVQYSYGTTVISATRTTPEAFELQKLFNEMRQSGCEYVVMEVSSHSLSQFRLGDSKLVAALFTNLTGDHLDYHGDMESYFLAKKKLFADYCKDVNTLKVINNDDSYGKRLLSEVVGNIISYGSLCCCNYRIQCNSNGNIEAVYSEKKMYVIETSLIGNFNAYNITGAVAICVELGISPDTVLKALKNFDNVPGRLELVKTSNGISCYVDYAHTDDALMRVLSALKQLNPNKLVVVFGCGGDRDRSKRPRMAKAVSSFADLAVITSDNPRTEDPLQIINDIISNTELNCEYKILPDRKEAIEYAVKIASKSDIILIAGKGHEDYQEVGTEKIPFDDRLVVKSIDIK